MPVDIAPVLDIHTFDLASHLTDTSISIAPHTQYFILEKLLKSDISITHKTKIMLAENAHATYFLLLSGGQSVAKDVEVVLQGAHSSARILGVYLGHDRQQYRFRVVSLHEGSNTQAFTWINGVLTDRSSSTFDGMVKIVPDIHLVNSYLANHVLLLGSEAQANAIPSLEIESNDVKCSHEATIGQIDAEHLFYLQSRGIPARDAEQLILEGFLTSVLSKIEDVSFREYVSQELNGMIYVE